MQNKEVRLAGNDIAANGDMIIEGYCLKFNSMSVDLGGFTEIITPEALANTELSDMRMFIDHDSSKILGRTTSGTLETLVDDIGLKVRCVLPDTTYARDIYQSIERGDVNQMSFGFRVADNGDSYTRQADGSIIRTLTNIESIIECSVVSIPAYSDTDVSIAQRNLDKAMEEQKKQKILIELELMKLQMTL